MSRQHAFTLVEVLAAVFLTSVVMTVALTLYVNISDATDAAAAKARRGRHSLAVLDRMARDLEGAYLVSKPAERDPLQHPWIFLAESHEGDSAADRLQFMTRNHRSRNLLDHGSDLARVSWLLRPSPDGPGYELLRAIQPGLPEPPANEFPSADDESFAVVAEGLEHFGIRFLDEEDWLDDWDSSQLEQSSRLPRAVEIEIAFLPESADDEGDFDDLGRIGDEDLAANTYMRRVLLPMEAVDVEAILLAAQAQAQLEDRDAAEGEDGEGDGEGEGDDAEGDSLESDLQQLLEGNPNSVRGRGDNLR